LDLPPIKKRNLKFLQFSTLLILLFSCDENSGIKTISISEEDKEALRYLKEAVWPEADREQDTILLNRILGEDFQMLEANENWSDYIV